MQISKALKSVDNPGAVVDRVYDLSKILSHASSANEYYEHHLDLKDAINNLKKILSDVKVSTLKLIEDSINSKIRELVTQIYDQHRKCPVLTLGEGNYKFEIYEDTGTGKAYSNLIVLDLSIFNVANVPFLIHDSLLFKNIENDAVANIIGMYEKAGRQLFIAIDEITKYGVVASKTLIDKSVIQLRDDKVLYIKDWRK